MEDKITYGSSLPRPFYYDRMRMEAVGTIEFYWRLVHKDTVHPVTFYVFPAGDPAGMELLFGASYIADKDLLLNNTRSARKIKLKCVRFCQWAAAIYIEISN